MNTTETTTFTLNNGQTFIRKANGYCYVTTNNVKTRIALPVFRANYDKFVEEENERQNAANNFVNIDALDEAAENPEVTLEQFIQMVQETEESNTDEEVKEIAKEMMPKAKKAKKTRKSKDIAYTYYADDAHTTALFTLTAKQVDFIRHLPDTCFWEKGLDSTPWTDVLCDEIGGQFAGKPMTVGAMISTLCEKGIAYRAKDRINNRTCTYMGLTEIGQAVAIDLGLNYEAQYFRRYKYDTGNGSRENRLCTLSGARNHDGG